MEFKHTSILLAESVDFLITDKMVFTWTALWAVQVIAVRLPHSWRQAVF